MTNRREFVQGAVALSALPAAAQAASAARPAAAVPQIALHAAVIDERFEASRAFGAAMTRRGVAVRPAPAGDVTALWNGAFSATWSQTPQAIAGLTAPPALFCLEQLAWMHRMRVVFHAEHIAGRDGALSHAVLRAASLPENDPERDLLAADADWPALVARMIAGQPAAAGPAGPSVAALERALDPEATTLVSWIIAPTGAASAAV